LIAHELTHVLQQRKNNAVGGETLAASAAQIQRKIGFEIEIPVILSKEVKGEQGTETWPPESGPELMKFKGGDVIVKADKDTTLAPLVASLPNITKKTKPTGRVLPAWQKLTPEEREKKLEGMSDKEKLDLELVVPVWGDKAPCVELVTPPWDETKLNRDLFKAKMQKVVDFAEEIRKQTKQFKKRVPLATGSQYYIGSDDPKADKIQNLENGNLQTTYGIRLSSIPALFERQATLPEDDPTGAVECCSSRVNEGDERTGMGRTSFK
jgi:hypothetical protein